MTMTPLRIALTAFLVAGAGAGAALATSDTSGEKSVLVRSRGPLTAEVVAALSEQGIKVQHVWPEINALAMTVPPSKLDALAASHWVSLLEFDQGGSVEGAPVAADAGAAAPPAILVPLFNGPGSISFPGQLPQSITAGAAGWTNQFATPEWFFEPVPANDPSQVYVADFSGRESPSDPPASRVDVLAPGASVFGEWLYGPGFSEGHTAARDAIDYFIFGTSFACPHVAGIAAQMLQNNPGLARGAAAVAATPAP